jgi:hypothetical protein
MFSLWDLWAVPFEPLCIRDGVINSDSRLHGPLAMQIAIN